MIYKPVYILYKKISDRSEINLIKSIIKPGMTVLDIGANIGFYTKLFSDLVGENGSVHAFEPDPGNFEKLNSALKNRKNVFLNNKAVGSINDRLKLYISKDLNVDHRTYSTDEERDYVEVDCVRLDDYLGQDSTVHFIKMDIQGYEYEALKGMKNICAVNHDIKMITEFWPYSMKITGVEPKDFLSLLRDLQFKIKNISSAQNLDYIAEVNHYMSNQIEYCNIFCEK